MTTVDYIKGTVTSIKNSASLIPNNLSVLTGLEGDSTTFAVVHKCSVNIVHIASGVCNTHEVFCVGVKDNSDSNSCLTGAQWCRLQSLRTVLVLTSLKGYEILEWNGSKSLYSSKIDTPHGTFENRFARGVASVGNQVCVGTSEGGIMMLEVPAQSGDVVYTKQLQGHTAPIYDLATNSKGQLASCDESGVIIVWLDPLTCEETYTVIRDPNGTPCMSLCFYNTLLIGGFAKGHIRIFDSKTRTKLVEIVAHAKYINALDIAPKAGLLLSASEDSTVCVWKLPREGDSSVSQVFSATMANSMLCGARFVGGLGKKFSVIGFETKELFTFSIAS